MACRLCAEPIRLLSFVAKEMMFGSGERFAYQECLSCGSLQIEVIPEDLGRHYPAGYYSFLEPDLRLNPLQTLLRRHRSRHYLGHRDLLGRLLFPRAPGRRPNIFRFLGAAGVDLATPILDVGCGGGGLLVQLRKYGFSNLTGLDPFIPRDIVHGDQFRLLKRSLEAEPGRYGLVMFHHSLEHVPDLAATLASAAGKLSPGGTILVRLPLAGGQAWRSYGADWVQLDPPRHLHLPSEVALITRDASPHPMGPEPAPEVVKPARKPPLSEGGTDESAGRPRV